MREKLTIEIEEKLVRDYLELYKEGEVYISDKKIKDFLNYLEVDKVEWIKQNAKAFWEVK